MSSSKPQQSPRMNPNALRTAFAVAGLLVLAGCSATRFAEVANLHDPRTIKGDSIDGSTLTLRQGSVLVLWLPATGGDAARWEIASLNPTVGAPIRIDHAPAEGPGLLPEVPPYSLFLARYNPPGAGPASTPADASKPSPVVAQGAAVVRLRAIALGQASVRLDYRRVDPAAAPATKSVRFDVAVVP
jgi:hypothetical protein